MANKNICLISTVHDPEGELLPFILLHLPGLILTYDNVVISITDKTHPNVIRAIGSYGSVGPTEGMAKGRQRVLELGLKTQADVFHYCDFDRILFWKFHQPGELYKLVDAARVAEVFIILERTSKAFSSHPSLQQLTEHIINLFSTRLYRADYYVDFLSGSRIIPRKLAIEILKYSKANNGAALDIEWPMILGRDNISNFKVDGLAYEHKYLGIEKPFWLETKTRLTNLKEALRVIYRQKNLLPNRESPTVHQSNS